MKRRTEQHDAELAALIQLRDEEIDTSDIPEIKDWSRAAVGKFYRPIKQPVTLRLDVDIVAWFKAAGKGYQSRINTLLRSAMTAASNSDAPLNRPLRRQPSRTVSPQDSNCDLRFPTLEKHGELQRYNEVAWTIEQRGSVFSPAS